MTKDKFADLVAEMRSNQKFFVCFGEKYRVAKIQSELKVDEALKEIYLSR